MKFVLIAALLLALSACSQSSANLTCMEMKVEAVRSMGQPDVYEIENNSNGYVETWTYFDYGIIVYDLVSDPSTCSVTQLTFDL